MKVVIAVDGSDCSSIALEQSFGMLKNDRDTIDIVTVIDEQSIPQEDLVAPIDNLKELQDIAQQILDRSKEICDRKGFKHTNTEILYGDTREEILTYIEKSSSSHPFDMIIVGSRGLSTFKKLMLGSVSEYLVHHSPIPVFVVKHNNVAPVAPMV